MIRSITLVLAGVLAIVGCSGGRAVAPDGSASSPDGQSCPPEAKPSIHLSPQGSISFSGVTESPEALCTGEPEENGKYFTIVKVARVIKDCQKLGAGGSGGTGIKVGDSVPVAYMKAMQLKANEKVRVACTVCRACIGLRDGSGPTEPSCFPWGGGCKVRCYQSEVQRLP